MPVLGVEVMVTDEVTGFNGAALTDTSGVTVTVTVDDPNGVRVLDRQALAYDADEEWWFYLWNTVDLDTAGTYKGKLIVTGVDTGRSFDKPVRWRFSADTMLVA